jgi:iron complex outermembrane recepter protein
MQLNRKYLFGTTLLAGMIVAAAPSFAQSQNSQSTTTSTQEEQSEAATNVEEVVVTGSRIRNPQFTSASPVQVITTEQTDLRGVPNAAQALLGSTLASSSFQLNDQLTGYIQAGGGGSQTIALRGLGTQRTLTLLNGKRAGPAGTRGQVQAFDLNNIPSAQVDRFDILKDGSSSIYGSDAIAGVINIITKRDLNGGSMNAYASQPFETGGEQYRLDATYGRTFERGYASLSAEYYNAQILRRSDRDDTACAQDMYYSQATGDRVDYIDPRTNDYKCYNLNNGYIQVIGSPVGTINIVPTSRYGAAYDYNVAGNNSPYAGYARFARAGFPGTYLYQPSDSRYYNEASMVSPLETVTLNFTGGYDLTPNAEVYTELLYNHRQSEQYGVGQIFPSFAQRNILNSAGNYLPASNPNNPFGVNVVPVAEYASNSNQTVDYYRGVLGVRGSFNSFGRQWDYDVYGQYSKSDASYDFGPRLYLDRFLATMSPNVACTNTPAGGNFSNFNCSALPNGVPWTSDRVLRGEFTDAERAFLFFEETGTTTYDHAYVEGVISTDNLFALPAGNVGFALGAQIRHEKIDDTPGYQAANRNMALFSSAGRTAGEDNIREIFAEFDLPLLANLPAAQNVNLNVSGRVSDYDSYGTSETYKLGLNWTLTPEYRVRASFGTSFRAPSLYEQFLGAQIGYGGQTNDPCYDYGNSGVDSQIQDACEALGIPADYTAVGGSSIPIAAVGGAGFLKAETAESKNLGVVWTPSFMPLSIAVDYFEIKINDAVDRLGAYAIIERCLRGNTAFCSLFTRATDNPATDVPEFYITGVNDSYTNVNEQEQRGIDLQIRYNQTLPFGRLTLETQHTWKLQDTINFLGGETDDYLNDTFNYGGPGYSGNFYATLTSGDLTYFYGIDMIGRGSDVEEVGGAEFNSTKYGTGGAGTNTPVRGKYYTEFYTNHSASVRYKLDDWSFQIGVQNLWDERPPSLSSGNFRTGTAALNGYDMRGRRGFVRIGRTF